jgi:hypothetical protein
MAQHLRAFDVNNDHLVDVVRTSGHGDADVAEPRLAARRETVASARRAGRRRGARAPGSSRPHPIESVRALTPGTPTDFEDPEVRLGDMNGDGIQDIVRIRRGRVQYWPGRGDGELGRRDRKRAHRGEGADRYIEMATPPAEINVELDGVYIEDVNEDGAADVVQVRFDAIDVWFNRAGRRASRRA